MAEESRSFPEWEVVSGSASYWRVWIYEEVSGLGTLLQKWNYPYAWKEYFLINPENRLAHTLFNVISPGQGSFYNTV